MVRCWGHTSNVRAASRLARVPRQEIEELPSCVKLIKLKILRLLPRLEHELTIQDYVETYHTNTTLGKEDGQAVCMLWRFLNIKVQNWALNESRPVRIISS